MSSARRALAQYTVRALLAVVPLTYVYSAHAQETPAPGVPAPPSADQRARAQQLFESALADAQKGDFSAACPKFRASQEADPKTSTLLNLGSCYEKNHQLASAWGAFKEASGRAATAGRADFQKLADERIAVLEPQLARLSVIVAKEADTPGLSITRDGAKLSSAERGVAIPADAGEHEITASAEGRVPWSTKITIVDGQDAKVAIPALAEAPKPPPPPTPPPPIDSHPPPPPPRPFMTTWRIIGVSTAGVGVSAMIVGGVLGAIAKGSYDTAHAKCQGGQTDACPSDAVKDAQSAHGLADAGTAVFVTGAVLTAAGAAIFFFAPTESNGPATARNAVKSASVRIAPWLSPQSSGLFAEGRF